MQQRTVAAALRMHVNVENKALRFDDLALSRLEAVLFDPITNQAVELPQPAGLTFNCMTDAMFEPANWRAFKAFVVRVKERSEASMTATSGW